MAIEGEIGDNSDAIAQELLPLIAKTPMLPGSLEAPPSNPHAIAAKYVRRAEKDWENRPATFELFPIDPIDAPHTLAIMAALRELYIKKETPTSTRVRRQISHIGRFLGDKEPPASLEKLVEEADRRENRGRILIDKGFTEP